MTIKYGEFNFKREHGFTGSAGGRKRTHFAEGGMRSESTQMARAKRDLSDAYDDAKPSYNPIKNITDIVSGRAMEKGANLSNALDRKKRADAETGEYKKGGMAKRTHYAEGGMRSESTQEAKASRAAQDAAFESAPKLNKALKNLNTVRKQTGYGLDDDAQGFARGGLRKMRIDKGRTKGVDFKGPSSSGSAMPGQLAPMEPAGLENPTPIGSPSPLSAVASSSNAMPGMKKGGKYKRK